MQRATFLTAAAGGVTLAVLLTVIATPARGHCEIPCGIYNDHARIAAMLEDVATIDKAVKEMIALAGKSDALSVNQMTRWTLNKEEHATAIQQTIAQYFLNQRVKPAPKGSANWNDYVTRLVQHHAVMVAAMKTKQTVDQSAVDELKVAVEAIAVYYPSSTAAPPPAPSPAPHPAPPPAPPTP